MYWSFKKEINQNKLFNTLNRKGLIYKADILGDLWESNSKAKDLNLCAPGTQPLIG